MPLFRCPLCQAPDAETHFKEAKNSGREFFRCRTCALVFVPPAHHVSPEAEKRRYDLHQNGPDDAGYRAYLKKFADPLLERLKPGDRGLDFGCGPGRAPVLAGMLEAAGHPMTLFDPWYAPDRAALGWVYDFVTATEVVEHLRRPFETLEEIWALVRPGGWLGIMTQFYPDAEAFGRWSYKNDPTHILFFSPRVFERLAARWGARLIFPQENVTLIHKT